MSNADNQPAYPKEFLEHLQSIVSKRPKTVINHILQHGFITAEDLQDENVYGYTQAARAARDVKECGVPLVGYYMISQRTGKKTYAYKFGNLDELKTKRIAGRIQFSKAFKHSLFEACGGHCHICNGQFEERYLQVDHRVPYEVGGDVADRKIEHFMLLCGSCNRAKSWSCEHCDNWHTAKNPAVCLECYWGSPESYSHIALEKVRRLDIQWNGDEIQYYDAIKIIADQQGVELPEFIKKILESRAGKNE